MKFFNSKTSKLSVIFLSCLLVTLIISSCDKSQKPEHDDNVITQKDIDVMKENHIISLKDAVKTYDKYTKQRVKILKDTLKRKYGKDFKDTRTVWFDIKTIKAYLKYLEDNTSEAEGLAFYFTVNLDNKGKGGNHQTFFIAPTIENIVNGDTIQSGYTVKKGKRVFLYEAFKEYLDSSSEATLQKASFFSLMQSGPGFLLNGGKDSPPEEDN